MYIKEPMEVYINDAASGKSTPGGGSVSALVGALGGTMACMASNFTVGKEKFKDVEDEVNQILGFITDTYNTLLDLMQKDTEYYAVVTKAYGMPKATEEEKKKRTEAIQEALKGALDIPFQAFNNCHDMLEKLDRLVDIANPNLISDVGVAALFAESGLQGAMLNVEINLSYLKDEAFVSKVRKQIDEKEAHAVELKNRVVAKVKKMINQ
jgi:formiminotetrahydrofolate cyclodeaminase